MSGFEPHKGESGLEVKYEEYRAKTLAVSIMKVPAELVLSWHAQMPFAQYVSATDESDAGSESAPQQSRSPSPPCSDEEERMEGSVIRSWSV